VDRGRSDVGVVTLPPGPPDGAPGADPATHVAQGPNPAKCLSVLSYGGTTLEALTPRAPWVLPVLVRSDDPFLLLAGGAE